MIIILIFVKVKPFPKPRYRLHYPEEDSHCIGLLTTAPLPLIGPIEIFGPSGLVEASLSVGWLPLELSEEQRTLAETFHHYIFSKVVRATKFLEKVPSSLPVIVPVCCSSSEIDWELCRAILHHSSENPQREVSSLLHQFQDLVLFPVAGETKGAENYFVEEVSDMTASTVMKGLGMPMTEFYQTHHQLTIRQPSQPLLRISSACRELEMFHPGGEPLADGKERSYRSYRLGELMGVEPVPAGLWKQGQMFPWVLHRVSSLLASIPFIEPSWVEEELSLDIKDQLEETEQGRMSRMKLMMADPADGVTTPSPPEMLQALTLLSARDSWNMERLEFLGDSFLKFSVTIFLYYKMKDACDEGDLSLARSRIVGNKNLYEISRVLQLANRGIVSDLLNPQTNWSPPGYVSCQVQGTSQTLEDALVDLEGRTFGRVGSLCKLLREEEVQDFITGKITEADLVKIARERKSSEEKVGGGGVRIRGYKVLSDKSQADCVEAMMGSYLFHCGPTACLQFMASIGINLSSSSEVKQVLKRVRSEETFKHFPPKKDVFVHDQARRERQKFSTMLNKLGVEEIENIIGYTFTEKSFLLEAFTHPSYEENRLTGSYEKLEFLGDAVLDYIITVYVYTHTMADPGTLTDIRSALVCNNMFASITTDLGLDKYILHCNPNILNKITSYLEDKWWQGYKPTPLKTERTMMQYNEEDIPQLEMVEVPKVLGDIFESVIGAVFVDSGHNLELVWNIWRKLCPELEAIVRDPPLNTKKKLVEMFPGEGQIQFSRVRSEDDRINIVVEVVTKEGTKRFQGRGRSKGVAELAACKCALRNLKLEK